MISSYNVENHKKRGSVITWISIRPEFCRSWDHGCIPSRATPWGSPMDKLLKGQNLSPDAAGYDVVRHIKDLQNIAHISSKKAKVRQLRNYNKHQKDVTFLPKDSMGAQPSSIFQSKTLFGKAGSKVERTVKSLAAARPSEHWSNERRHWRRSVQYSCEQSQSLLSNCSRDWQARETNTVRHFLGGLMRRTSSAWIRLHFTDHGLSFHGGGSVAEYLIHATLIAI